MPATTIRTEIDGLQLARSPRMMPQRPEGFPAAMLERLFLFRETGVANGMRDEISGASFPVRNGVMQSGGGIQFAEGALLGPTFDVRTPWTLCVGLTVAPPPGNGIAGRRAMLSVGDYDQRGFLAWINPTDNSPFSSGSPHAVMLRQTISGTPAPNWPGIQWMNSPVQYGKPEVLVIAHEGEGSVFMQLWRKLPSGDGALQAQVATEWDMSLIGGQIAGVHSYNLEFRPGTINGIPDYAPATAIYDSAAIYRGLLNDREILTYVQANAALAASRGRTA